jgi:hypothetical protein
MFNMLNMLRRLRKYSPLVCKFLDLVTGIFHVCWLPRGDALIYLNCLVLETRLALQLASQLPYPLSGRPSPVFVRGKG